jgi:hypothetical protein
VVVQKTLLTHTRVRLVPEAEEKTGTESETVDVDGWVQVPGDKDCCRQPRMKAPWSDIPTAATTKKRRGPIRKLVTWWG